MSTNLTILRGDSASIGFVVYAGGTDPFDLTGWAVEFAATNGTQSIAKSLSGGGITVAAPLTGAGTVAIAPADTSGWPDVTDPLDWYVRITKGAEVYTVADGTLSVVLTLSPVVTGVSAAEGPSSGGTVVTISGTGFTGATAVSFGGAPATVFSVDDATTVTATVPAHVAGSVTVSVTTPYGTATVTDAFTYYDLPEIISISPPQGPAWAEQTVTITGRGLTGATAVSFAGLAATSFVVNSAASISAVVPAHAAGQVDVVVTTPRGTYTLAGGYTVFAPAPAVTSVSPTSGLTAGGEYVTLSGTGFTGATLVTFGGVAASSFTVNSDTSISALVPAHAAAAVDVVVTGPEGAGTLSGGYTFAPRTPARTVYCTEEDLDSEIAGERLAELTAETGTIVDSVTLSRVLEQASSTIDRRLAGRYATPITDPATLELLVPVCAAIVKFRLFGRRDLATKDDPVRVAYDEAQKWLRDVAMGDDSLPLSAALAGATDDAGALRMGSDDQVFGGGTW